jgi:Tol biopolymer transport system component
MSVKMRSTTAAIGCMVLFVAGLAFAADPKGPYLGRKPLGPTPEVFAPGVISVEGSTERSLSLSPKGDELFFTRSTGWPHSTIMHMKQRGDTWSMPERASFLKDDWATQAVFSPDGQYLYYSTSRGKSDIRYFSLWRSRKTGDAWSEPQSVIDIGGGLMMEFHPSVARSGSVYFLSWDFERQTGDIYVARLIDGKYAEPALLGPPVSTEHNEVRPTVDPNERYLLFESNRPGGYGETDIYIAFRDADGTWSSVRNLGPTINTPGVDDTPNISPDGKYWFFSRGGDVYWRQAPTALLDPNSPTQNLAAQRQTGSR